MKSIISIICLIMGLSASKIMANPINLLDDIDSFNEHCSGVSLDTVHLLFGNPQGMLSGFWGDIYFNSDNQAVIIYYDENGKVDFAVLGGWSKPNKENGYTEMYNISDEPPFWLMDNN